MLKKRYILISTLIHCLVLVPMLLKQLKSEPEKDNTPSGRSSQVDIIEIKPIELSDVGTKQPKLEDPKFYWGVGIDSGEETRVIPLYGKVTGHIVVRIYSGYSAYNSGLEVGDFIFIINDDVISPKNDLRGDTYSTLRLTVQKMNGKIIVIQTERSKVLY